MICVVVTDSCSGCQQFKVGESSRGSRSKSPLPAPVWLPSRWSSRLLQTSCRCTSASANVENCGPSDAHIRATAMPPSPLHGHRHLQALPIIGRKWGAQTRGEQRFPLQQKWRSGSLCGRKTGRRPEIRPAANLPSTSRPRFTEIMRSTPEQLHRIDVGAVVDPRSAGCGVRARAALKTQRVFLPGCQARLHLKARPNGVFTRISRAFVNPFIA